MWAYDSIFQKYKAYMRIFAGVPLGRRLKYNLLPTTADILVVCPMHVHGIGHTTRSSAIAVIADRTACSSTIG